ncbi:M15 family metallopeptidase [Patescibacteria group bacterium]|nr:M15 family metallopeptidase [Patescibacteria group bacterium]
MLKDKIKFFFNQTIHHEVIVALLFFLIIPSIAFGFWLGYKSVEGLSNQITSLSKNVDEIEFKLASTTIEIAENINKTQLSLSEAISKEKEDTNQKFSNFENEVGTISGTVTSLEKLSKTDPELLQKYSKVFFLNEHFSPARLAQIPEQYNYFEKRNYQFYDKAWPYLQNMLNKAKSENVELYVYSAFRSFDTQEALKSQYAITYGSGTANQFSADQGYSEHQLGTTVDLITTGIDGTLSGFDETNAYSWLLQNAHKFGFVLSYPENNDYYMYEPWHWRFVGVKLATYLKNNNKHFYDLDQREIDEYLISIFD